MGESRSVGLFAPEEGEEAAAELSSAHDVRRVDAPSELLDGDYDCVVCVGEASLSGLATAREAGIDLPVLFCTPEPDGEAAAEATRLGASEYVPLSTLDESLAGRVTAAVGTGDADAFHDAVFDHPTSFVGLLAPDGTLLRANETALSFLDADEQRVVGRPFPETPWWDDADRPVVRENVERAAAGETVRMEAQHSAGDEYVSLDVVFQPVVADDEVVGIVVTGQDVTELRESSRALQRLHAITSDLDRDFPEKAEAILDLGREYLDLDVGFLSYVEGDDFEIVEARGNHPKLQSGSESPLGETYCRRLVDAESDGGRPMTVERASEEGWEGDPAHEQYGLGCYIGERVVVDGETYGTLCFADTDDRDATFSESEETFVELATDWLGSAIGRRRRERELRRYRAVHENVREMVFVLGPDGRIRLTTDALDEQLGRESVVGLRASDLLSAGDRDRAQEAIRRLVDGDADTISFVVDLPAADGGTFPAEIELTTMGDDADGEAVGVVRDRTELEATRSELADERERFGYLFERMPDPVVDAEVTADALLVRDVNAAFEEVFGYDAEEVVGRDLKDLIVPDDRQSEAEALNDRARDGVDTQDEVERLTADGRRQFLFRGVQYRATDDRVRSFGIYTDVTDRINRERRLSLLGRVLRHNIRNEMTTVLGYADMLTGNLDDERAEWAATVTERAERVVDLAEDARDIERVLDPDREATEPGDLAAIVAGVAEDARREYPNATVEVDAAATTVRDAELVETALGNLVENAVVHNDDDPWVRIEGRRDGDEAVVTVSDDGDGIPELERGVVSGGTETQLEHSTGLGLWLVRTAADAVGGDLSFADRGDGGSAVTLRIPVAE